MQIIIIFVILFFSNKKIRNSKASKYIVLLYVVSIATGYVLELLSFDFEYDKWNYFNLLLIVITLLISFKSLDSLDLITVSNKIEPLLSKSLALKIIVFLSVISSIIYLVDFLNFIRTPDLGAARLQHQLEEGRSRGFIYSFFATISFSYHINLFIYFDLVRKNKNKIALLVLFGSFSYIFWVSSAFGRDGFVFWIISFFFYYFLFKNKLSKIYKRKLKKIMLVFGTLFIILFYNLSSSRFENHKNYTSNNTLSPVVLSILDYTGQQLRNINTYYNMEIDHTYGSYNYPFVYRQLISDKELGRRKEMIQMQIASNGKPHFYFAFFLKELWVDFGKTGTLIICFFFTTIIGFISRNGGFLKSYFLIYIVYTQFLIMGLFYNKFYFPSANAFLLLIVVLITTESMFYGKKKKSISSNNNL